MRPSPNVSSMHTSNSTYTIAEYAGFQRGGQVKDGPYQSLPTKIFDALEEFILANRSETETEVRELLSLSLRGGKKVIIARNYVGLLAMNDGTIIEILPKIADSDISDDEEKKAVVRQIFLKMLQTLRDAPFKEFNFTQLKSDRLPLFEIFIRMFLDEVAMLARQGLKAAYTSVEANEYFYRGKLLTAQNIRHNLVRPDRFYVCYDEFNLNRPENRLIKSTLRLLLHLSHDNINRRNAIRLLYYFDCADFSINYDVDFARCILDRSMSHYERALSWCRVLLCGNSFTAYAGSKVAIALLFPMEKIFESFVAAQLRNHFRGKHVKVKTQNSLYNLFDDLANNLPCFALRPDIVLEFEDGRKVVIDTKWKLLSRLKSNSGPSQADMYQMYAYGMKYQAEVMLLYPRSEDVLNGMEYESNEGVKVKILFLDLEREASDWGLEFCES